MPGYELLSDDLEKIPSKYICEFCKLVLCDPMQTPCAHFYCRDCLGHLKSEDDGDEVYKCKTDDEQFKRSEVFPDRFVRNEIQDCTVHCRHKESGCEWFGPITSLNEHVSGCDFLEIPCVFEKCNAKVLKSNLAQHLETDCSQRQTECRYCSQEIRYCDLEEHVKKDCQAFPIDCSLCDKKEIPRGKLREHHDPAIGDCEGSKAVCPFCSLGCSSSEVMARSERRLHEQNLMMIHLNLLVNLVYSLTDQVGSFFNEMSSLKESVTVIEVLKSTVSQLVSQLTVVVNENGNIKEEIRGLTSRLTRVEEDVVEPDSVPVAQRHSLQTQYQQISGMLADFKRQLSRMEEKFANHELLLYEANQLNEEQNQEIARLKRQGESDREALLRLQAKMNALEETLKTRNAPRADNLSPARDQEPTSFDGVLIWKITHVSAKIYDSYREPEKSFYSPPFCTSRHGYKMCARIYLNGDGMGKGTHISLFFVIMRGEYDALLRWPFRQKVTFMLLDHNNVEHAIDAFRPDPNSSSFQRPKRESNIASGCPLFFPLSDLNKHTYVKDDTMFIKVIVDCVDL
ncbi:TNF receptor-associated factor 1-like [Montipora capricornis]|uniref:TNF receptor-associated factor 1-like n=1 Tax=Montipora capricornis TaxID=246305 RepID=UPI0035F19C78